MIRVLVLAASVALAAPAMADNSAESVKVQYCTGLGKLAAQMMEARQLGTPLSALLKIISDTTDNAIAAKHSTGIAKGAYEHPRWSGPDAVKRSIQDYRNDIETECFRDLQVVDG